MDTRKSWWIGLGRREFWEQIRTTEGPRMAAERIDPFVEDYLETEEERRNKAMFEGWREKGQE